MTKLSDAEIAARDAQRDLNAELLEAIEELHAGRIGRVIRLPSPEEDAAITAAADSDPDARPLTDEEWAAVAHQLPNQDKP
jgi:hypothetical protein